MENLQKYFLRFYYNTIYLNKLKGKNNVVSKRKSNFGIKSNLNLNEKNKNIDQLENKDKTNNTNYIIMNMNITNNNDVNNNNSTNNNNNNINEEKKEEKQKEENSPENKHSRARNLRNSLKKRNKEKLELLRKYFNKFHQAGILLALRKTTKLAYLYEKIGNVDLGTAMNTIVNSETMNDIEILASSSERFTGCFR